MSMDGNLQGIQYIKTKAYTDKLICHIAAVLLHLSKNKEFECSNLAKALKKEPEELKEYFREIGASCITSQGKEKKEILVSYSIKRTEAKKIQQQLQSVEGEV